jgi:hypothetical protein
VQVSSIPSPSIEWIHNLPPADHLYTELTLLTEF